MWSELRCVLVTNYWSSLPPPGVFLIVLLFLVGQELWARAEADGIGRGTPITSPVVRALLGVIEVCSVKGSGIPLVLLRPGRPSALSFFCVGFYEAISDSMEY